MVRDVAFLHRSCGASSTGKTGADRLRGAFPENEQLSLLWSFDHLEGPRSTNAPRSPAPCSRSGRHSKASHAWVDANDAKGQLPGCWRPELGQLGQLIALRGCAALEDMAAERRRALLRAPPRCRRRGGRVGDGERGAVPLFAADPDCLPGRAARARFWVMSRFFDSGISAMRQAGMRSDTPPTAQASGPRRGRLQIGSPRDGLGDPRFTPSDQRCDRCQDGGEAEQPPPDLRPGDHPVIDAPPGPR